METIISETEFLKFKKDSFGFRTSTVKYRKELLKSLRDSILNHQVEICEALAADFNKPVFESELTEIFPTITEINHTLEHLATWMRPKNIASPLSLITTDSTIHYRPRGCCLIIAPWNYPFQLAIAPLVAAISAGNSSVVKPSEFAPCTSLILKKIINKALPEKIARVEIGDHEISEQLTSFPFDHIFFTGSTAVGKKIMTSAVKNMTSLTLELGGKSPVIIDSSADIKGAAEKLFWGKYLNAGQTCVAPDYVFIHHSVEKKFCSHFVDVFKSHFDEKTLGSSQYSGLIHQRHFQRIQRLLASAIDCGNELIIGGKSSEEKCAIEVSLIKIKNFECEIMQDEIFGPLLPYITFDELDECIEYINSRPHPLALYIFSNESSAIQKILGMTLSGGACINEIILHLANPDLPFGGIGNSGVGSYHGFSGFKAFSHEQSVLKQNGPRWISKIFYPPYSGWKRKMINFLIRFL